MGLLLENKTAVVTGAKGLLGSAIVKHLSENGATVVEIDLDTKDIPKLLVIDILVNCIRKRRQGFLISSEELDEDMHNEVTHLYEYCMYFRDFLPPGSAIVNMASIQGLLGTNRDLYASTDISSPISYNIAKAGIIGLTRYLATFLAPEGIRVNSISPGGIRNQEGAAFVSKYSSLVPMGRMGKPEEIASCVTFLASDWASYITGHNLVVDGGYTVI